MINNRLETAKMSPADRPASGVFKQAKPVKVLIVEDSEVQAGMYKLVFAKKKSELIFAQNGKEAVQILAREPNIGLIISDINMPEMNGIELLSMVKRTRLANCPVIIISTSDNVKVMEKAVADKVATHYVVKPWNLKAMWDLVEKVLN